MLRSTLQQIRVRPHAMATDVVSAGALGFVADATCQLFAEGRSLPPSDRWRWRCNGEPPHDEAIFDPRRLAALTAFSSVYIGGFLHVLYQFYPLVVRGASRRLLPDGTTLQKKLLNETTLLHAHACAWVDNVHCGVIYIPAYFVGVGLLQGDSASESRANLRSEWWPTYASCTIFWVPFMMGNFALLPPARRVQAMSIGNLGWSVVIDFLAHRGTGSTPNTAIV